MNEIGLDDEGQYYQYLNLHPKKEKEFDRLLSEITINETSFFRIMPHFTALREFVFPDIVKRRKESGKRIRIWSAGCSSGEEPYSIAMSIKEFLGDTQSWKIEILASDIDKQILDQARRGIYRKRSLKYTDPRFLTKYFTQHENTYELKEDIKEMVNFQYLNLLQDKSATRQDNSLKFDLIFCRNVLIYFGTLTQQRVLNVFFDSLYDGGSLFLGHSEIVQYITNRFVQYRYKQAFFHRKESSCDRQREKKTETRGSVSDLEKGRKTNRHLSKPVVLIRDGEIKECEGRFAKPKEIRIGPPQKENPEECLDKAFDSFIKEKYERAGQEVNEYLKVNPKDAEALFLDARISLELGDKEKALEKCLATLDANPLVADARFFLGVVYQDMGKHDEAVSELGKAIYIDQDFALAYFYRGRIYEKNSDSAKAIRDYEVTKNILRGRFSDEPVGFLKGVTNGMLVESLDRNIRSLEVANA
jgi:chemotaxis protein methyltransferase CheR